MAMRFPITNLLRDGVRYSTRRIDRLHFGADTPLETLFTATPATPDTVLSADVAAVARAAMTDVVERGAVRARGAFTDDSTGTPLVMGGKTGTGDNRIRTTLRSGARTNIALNRTSTFVFFAGDRFFGTVTAYAPGPGSDAYRFTSSLPAQVLTLMGPELTLLTHAFPASTIQNQGD